MPNSARDARNGFKNGAFNMAENLSYTHKKEYVEVDHRGQARGDTEVAIGHGLGMVVSGQESALEVREVLNYFRRSISSAA